MKEIISNFRKELRTQKHVLVYKRISEYVVLIGVPTIYDGKHEIWYVNAKSLIIMQAFACNGRKVDPSSFICYTSINYFGQCFCCQMYLTISDILDLIRNTSYLTQMQFLQKIGICITYDLLSYDLTNVSIKCLKKFNIYQNYTSFADFHAFYKHYSGNIDPIFKYKLSSYYLRILNQYIYLSVPELSKVAEKIKENPWVYPDYIRMRKELLDNGYKIKCPLVPVNKSVKYWHDYILSIYQQYSDQIRACKVQNAQQRYIKNYYEQAKSFEYKNDEYTIIACKDLSELYVEGKYLNHCVGSYIDVVSEGKDYILFLRKCSDPEIPYFTLDLSPLKVLRQAQGKCNCNMSKEIMPFIKEWAHKFNINITNIS